jgi:hypothetical protein
MRRILTLTMVAGALVGAGAGLASGSSSRPSHVQSGKAPAAKAPARATHHCHLGTASYNVTDL